MSAYAGEAGPSQGSSYAGVSSVAGSAYAGGRPHAKKKGGSFGLNDLGIVGNLIGDTKDALLGIVPGTIALATHPIRAAEQVGQSYAETYGPLLHGDIGQFAHGFYEHPLGPILDIAALFTGGATAVAKGGSALAKAGLISDTSRLAHLGDIGELTLQSSGARAGELGARTVTKTTSANPLIRARQNLVFEALGRLDYEFPVIGELARYSRATRRGPAATASVLKQSAAAFDKAFGKLNDSEKIAFNLYGRLPLTEHLDTWKAHVAQEAQRGNKAAAELLDDVNDEKVMRLYAEPSKRMQVAHAEGAKLGDRAADELARVGVLTKGQAEQARYRHTLLAAGGTLDSSPFRRNAMLRSPAWVASKRRALRLEKRTAQIQTRLDKFPLGSRRYTAAESEMERVSGALSVAHEDLARVESRYRTTPTPTEGPTLAQVRDQIAAAGRPQPLYLPDVAKRAERRTGGNNFSYSSPVKRSEGLLFMTGRLALEPDTLTPMFLKTATYAHWRDLHDALLDSSVKILPGGSIPDGWVWLKRPPGVSGEGQLSALIPNPDEVPERLAAHGFSTHSTADAVTDGKARYAVPAKLANQFNAEFQRSNKAVRWFLEKPTTVWRALVLNLRVAWLVNNVLGNHLLYALRYAGVGGLRGYLDAIRTSKGAAAVQRLLHDPLTRDVVSSTGIADSPLRVAATESSAKVVARAAEDPGSLTLYRGQGKYGSKPGAVRTVTGDKYHDFIFASDSKQYAASYGPDQEKIVLRAGARILRPDAKDLESRSPREIAEGAKRDGYDAVVFSDQAYTGTAILNNGAILWRGGVDDSPPRASVVPPAPVAVRSPPVAVQPQQAAVRGSAVTSADIAELLPEQAGGTFIGTQAPNVRGGRALRKAGLGLASADKAVEGGLRRAAVNVELRRDPAVKARLAAMPREARSFREAARQALTDEKVAARVSENVNKALGDFLSLGPAEKRYVRAVFPFYAWYKAITQIVVRLPLDSPVRAAILVKLGEVGKETEFGPVPSYLEGAIGLGGDRILKTQGANPFATVPQLGRAAAVPFFPGQPTNQLAGTLNPFVQLVGGSVFGRDKTKRGLLADFASGLATDLPQVTLARDAISGPAPSKLYKPSATDDLLAYLGAGVKTINRKRAAELAAQGS